MAQLKRMGPNLLTGDGVSIEFSGPNSQQYMNLLTEEVNDEHKGILSDTIFGRKREILDFLASKFGKWVTIESIMNHLYVNDPEGGADDRIVDVYICLLRKLLKGTEYEIQTGWGGLRRLVKVGTPGPQKHVNIMEGFA